MIDEQPLPPRWAMRRVQQAFVDGGSRADDVAIGRRTGLGRSLVRRCLAALGTGTADGP